MDAPTWVVHPHLSNACQILVPSNAPCPSVSQFLGVSGNLAQDKYGLGDHKSHFRPLFVVPVCILGSHVDVTGLLVLTFIT